MGERGGGEFWFSGGCDERLVLFLILSNILKFF